MTTDARFEDGGDTPLMLKAHDTDDLTILSALCQDAIVPVGEISYNTEQRRFAMLLNRFRWEDVDRATKHKRSVERVQSVLLFDDVLTAKSSGVSAKDKETVISILSITFTAGPDGTGTALITLAGDGEIHLALEALDITLKDVTRPYVAPSKKQPTHKA
ncbi:DUF2948 family protein [Pacificibacter maritimus]|uniref:DUF2948 family protein n=1 Tax=Pacificibacter maritimus TaxID=762213 RepID=A0A3N4U897_9RHOB|nr:DUF2948 family protein [Pacificibacter maritimus]RPE66963.1 DUF2948 family protein [Pacificibacter maritimus]